MEPVNSAQYVYEKLMEEISEGAMTPGQRLPAIPIAQKYGVSRTPVLEALRRMEGEGIVLSYPGKGACLINPSLEEVREFFVVRGTLEKKALELVADKPGLVFLSRLREAIDREKELSGGSVTKAAFIRASMEFHHIIAEYCGNSLLQRYIQNVLSNIYVFQMLLYDVSAAFDDSSSWRDHERILAMIEAGQAERVCAELERHVMASFEQMTTGL